MKGLVSDQGKGESQRKQKQMGDSEISKTQGCSAESKLRIPEVFGRDAGFPTLTRATWLGPFH